MKRPGDLPEFAKPPLNEVVLGIQFDPPVGYQQIRAGEIWSLFKADFPNVQELPALQPVFETFGPLPSQQLNFGFTAGALHDRFWFLSASGAELIQFQNDRLLHNWRKVGDQTNPYPRFESIIDKFQAETLALEEYMQKLRPQKIAVRQCEISYINHIRSVDGKAPNPAEWLKFVSPEMPAPDDFAASFRRTIWVDRQPRGRLICESSTALDQAGRPFLALTITARGIPDAPDMKSALEFVTRGREMIVRLFTEITTESAHQAWGRSQ